MRRTLSWYALVDKGHEDSETVEDEEPGIHLVVNVKRCKLDRVVREERGANAHGEVEPPIARHRLLTSAKRA